MPKAAPSTAEALRVVAALATVATVAFFMVPWLAGAIAQVISPEFAVLSIR